MVVALPWQVELTNSPTAMGVVAAAQMVPIVAFTLVGGVASDRIDRRKVFVAADHPGARRRRGRSRTHG